jgi:AraC-like DNA-binding protein
LIVIEDVSKRDPGQYRVTMPKVSVALILTLLLAYLAIRLIIASRHNRSGWPFAALVVGAALQALLVSLRWDFGLLIFRPLQILVSCLLPALAWISFRAFSTTAKAQDKFRNPLHLLPAVLCGVALYILPDAIDFIIMATFIVYGISCLRLALKGESALDRASLSGVIDVQRALWLVIFSLFASVVVDLLVFLDFLREGGAQAPLLIGIGNIVWLVAIGLSALLTSRAVAETDEDDTIPIVAVDESEHDTRVLETAESMLTQGGLAKDPNLTLTRLARRCGIPARSISRAVNRVHKRNVSQFVNDVRVREACRLLKDTPMTITQAIYESGFQTKSNFNREFLRVTGKTPRDWRAKIGESQ